MAEQNATGRPSNPPTLVHHQPERQRFVAESDGRIAGFAAYELAGSVITFTHTVVGGAYEGKGIGGTLVRAALDDARSRGLRVVPSCPFVAAWMDRHPDYLDLLSDSR